MFKPCRDRNNALQLKSLAEDKAVHTETTKNDGWTLIELMLVLSILTIVGLISLPAMQGFIEQNRIVAASNMLVAHLNFARTEAITRRTFVSACPSPNFERCSGNQWDQGWIVFLDPQRTGQPSSTEDILRVVPGNQHLRMHSGGRFRVRFQPMGGAYGTNLTIRVCGRSARSTPSAVIVSNPGRARVDREFTDLECV